MIPEEHHDLLAPEGDVEALAECIRRLMSRSVEELRDMASRGREKMERDFNPSNEVGSLRTIYRDVVPTMYIE
jgi:glycosyltransferase involved in cell wall biosynthesis